MWERQSDKNILCVLDVKLTFKLLILFCFSDFAIEISQPTDSNCFI